MFIETAAVQPRVVTATTAGLAGRDKFDYWHEIVCRTLVDLECRPFAEVPFEASVSGVVLDGMSVSSIQASPHRVSRLPSGIARSGSESLVFNFVVSGQATADQDGRTVVLKAGDGAVCDAERPYKLCFDNDFNIVTVKLPRAAFSHRTGSVHRVTAISLANAGHLCPILFSYVLSLSQQAPLLGASSIQKISRNFTELLGAALDELILCSPLPLSEYRATALMRVKDFIERHLDDYELDSALVATQLQLAPRYINKLFEAEGTSIARYIWRRRLERTAADLKDRSLQSQSVSVIAMSHGFNDLSHFSRVFKQRFGVSPREYRRGDAPLQLTCN